MKALVADAAFLSQSDNCATSPWDCSPAPGAHVQLPYKWDERDPLDSCEAEKMRHPSLM